MTYNAFTTPKGQEHKEFAIIASEIPTISADECYDFADIMMFLYDFPPLVSGNRGGGHPNILIHSGVKQVAGKWFRGRTRITVVPRAKTIPDPAVEAILALTDPHPKSRKQYINAHYECMAAENIIGGLLERYIAETLAGCGWIWCSGEIIKGVDFIQRNGKEDWIALQVKNRSNTENSSSKTIRDGTDIIKWHRINAYNGNTYWEDFPDTRAAKILSEEGFQEYIRTCLS